MGQRQDRFAGSTRVSRASQGCHGAVLLQGLPVLFCICYLQIASASAGDSPVDLALAEVIISASETPPEGKDWRPVTLPDTWRRRGPRVEQKWYRFRLPDDQPAGITAVYLWRFSMNVAVWLNRDFLGDGGRFEEPMARNWNRPFLFTLPSSSWQERDNYLYVRVAGYSGWGNLYPVTIGPLHLLRDEYERRYFWQILLNQASALVSILSTFVVLTFWLSNQREPIYGIFALTCLSWTMYSLNGFVQNIPVSAETWWWLAHSCIDWYAVTLGLFIHRLLGLARPLLDRMLIGFGVVSTLIYLYLTTDLYEIALYNNYIHIISLFTGVYLFGLSGYESIRRPSVDSVALAICMLVVVVFGAHDILMNTELVPGLWQNHFFWLQYAAPVLLITMLVILSRRFVTALNRRLDAEQEIRIERERIFTDIHDDVGSKILSLVYGAESRAQAELARDALREVRRVVSGAAHSSASLPEVVQACQAEAQQRCDAANILLQWNVVLSDDLPASDTLQYHFQRMLRELMTNCIKHAGTDRIEVLVSGGEGELSVCVRDFGDIDDQAVSAFTQGTGIASVLRRANELGGGAAWSAARPGCRVNLHLPLTD